MNMKIHTIKLQNNKVIGCAMFEIMTVPLYSTISSDINQALQKNRDVFLQFINELYKYCNPNNTVFELLWTTEKVENQAYPSRIRLFFVIRNMSNTEEQTKTIINEISDNFWRKMNSISYSIRVVEKISEIGKISNMQINAIVKSEKCEVNSNAYLPYYYCDIIEKSNHNFNELTNVLSSYTDAAVSFQLIPTALQTEEITAINQMTTTLSRIAIGMNMPNGMFYKDAMAQKPYETYLHYNNVNQPFFNYNILVFGNANSAAALTAKIISILQMGEMGINTASYDCISLKNENISINRDFMFYPWNVNSQLIYKYRNIGLWKNLMSYQNLKRLPYTITSQEAVSFFRLPIDDNRIVGIDSNKSELVVERFSDKVVNANNFQFGYLKSVGDKQVQIGCPNRAFTKHALIVGSPGSGKTTFSVNMLLQFYKKKIPFIAIEPTKTEYRAMIDVIDGLQIFTPGNNRVSPFIINPFIPPKGIRIEQYIPSLASAFKAAFSMPSPLDMIFLKTIRTCYTEYGWKDYSKYGDEDVKVFGLYEFIRVFKRLVRKTDYSKDVKNNIETGGVLRLLNLIEQNSNIYDTINTVPIEDILTKPTVLELNAIDNAEQKSLIIALLLISVCVYTKHNQVGDGELKNVLLIDEAHVLLGGKSVSNPDGATSQETTVKSLQDMIAEIRSYGTGIIIADQSPNKVSREIVANTDIKVMFRLVETDDKNIISDSTNMSDNSKSQLSQLGVGEAFVYYNELNTPQLIKTEDVRNINGIRLSVPDDEIAGRMIYWNEHSDLLIPFRECELSCACNGKCDFYMRSKADYYASKYAEAYGYEIKDKEMLYKYLIALKQPLSNIPEKSDENYNALCNCIKIRFLRKILIDKNIYLSNQEIKGILSKILI